MKKLIVFLLVSITTWVNAQVAFTITGASGPNTLSASWAEFNNNRMSAITAGNDSAGTVGTPGYYTRSTVFSTPQNGDFITASGAWGKELWKGEVNPTGAFAGEIGNVATFTFSLVSTSPFTVSGLSFFSGSSPGSPIDLLERSKSIALGNFGSEFKGVWYGADGVKGGVDDIVYSAGAISGVSVNEFYGAPSAGSTSIGASSDLSFANAQAYAVKEVWGEYRIQTSLGNFSDKEVIPTPEPSEWALVAGIGIFGFVLWRRHERRLLPQSTS